MVRSTPLRVAVAAVCSEDGESHVTDTSHTESDDMLAGSCTEDHVFLADLGSDQVPKSKTTLKSESLATALVASGSEFSGDLRCFRQSDSADKNRKTLRGEPVCLVSYDSNQANLETDVFRHPGAMIRRTAVTLCRWRLLKMARPRRMGLQDVLRIPLPRRPSRICERESTCATFRLAS